MFSAKSKYCTKTVKISMTVRTNQTLLFLSVFIMQSGTEWSRGGAPTSVSSPEVHALHCGGERTVCCSQSARPQPQR